MKKLFASLMAATMVAGMSVSAFAYAGTDGKAPTNDMDGDKTADDPNVVSTDVDDDYSFVSASNKKENGTVYGGNSIYFPILVNADEVEDDDEDEMPAGYFYATKSSEVKDLKVSYKESEGKGTIKSATIERVKAGDHKAVDAKIYCIKVKLNDYFETEEGELEFDLTLKEKGKEQLKMEDIYFTLGQDDANSTEKSIAALAKDPSDNALKPYVLDADGNKTFPMTKDATTKEWKNGAAIWVGADGKVTTAGSTAKVVKVKESNEDGYGYEAKFKNNLLELTVGENTKAVTLDEFGKADDNKVEELYMETADGEMIVEGLLEEQDALFLGFEADPTDFQKDVMMENSKADVTVMNWVARPTFDFNMDVTVPVDEDEDNFLYEEIDGKLVEVEAELNEDGDALEFRTKTLGKYLLSDMELDAVEVEEEAKEEEAKEEATEKEDGKKVNAETGASVVAVATAIALF